METETIKGLKRTNYCGELRLSDAGKEINMLIGKSAGADTGNPDKLSTVGRAAGDGTDNNRDEKI